MSTKVTRVVFTVNNYSEAGYESLKAACLAKCKYVVIGKEVGEQGTRHLQGFIILKKQQRLSAVTTWIEAAAGKHPYTAKAAGTNNEASNYCKKDGIFFENGNMPTKKGERTDIKDYLDAVKAGADDELLSELYPACYAKYTRAKDQLRRATRKKRKLNEMRDNYQDASLRTWQRLTLNKLKSQDNRKVTWVYDPDGNIGKSFLANYLLAKENTYLVEGGKRADVAYAYNYEEFVVFDFTRSQEENVNYSTIESFKNGRIFSSKYESGLKLFNPAKVLCLSNFYPDKSKLSEDRWQILQFNMDDPAEPPRKKPRLSRNPCQYYFPEDEDTDGCICIGPMCLCGASRRGL